MDNMPNFFESGYPAAVVLAGIFLSLALEKFTRPYCPGLVRPPSSAILHFGLFLLAWAAIFLVVRRPVFALLLVLSGQLLIIQVNNAKYRALREPFLFSDFGIFSQAIRHPRLYLPFFGIRRAVLIATAIAAAVGFGWWAEKPIPGFSLWSGSAALIGTLCLYVGWLSAEAPSLNPEKDVASRGLLVSIIQYWLREKTTQPTRQTHLPAIRRPACNLPDIVVIQSESFFDARRLFPGIRHKILRNYDIACTDSTWHGQLEVPAWGANTMRPEFGFLTGLSPV
jgi:hypothetical protein